MFSGVDHSIIMTKGVVEGMREYDGGAFMNQASHYVDLVEWMIGPVEQVQAMMSTTRNIEAEDTGVLNIRWAQWCFRVHRP